MKKPITPPTIGTTGPRRPTPATPPISYERAPVCALRALPIRENHRIQLLSYRLTDAPGMTGKARTHGHGSARLAGYVIALCLTRDGGQFWLEIESRCHDEEAARREKIAWSLQILADLYRAVERRHMAAQGMAYGRAAGRN